MQGRLSILTRDPALEQALLAPLNQAGFEVRIYPPAPKLWQQVRRSMSNVLLVDLDSMGQEALAQCRRLRAMTSIPIIAIARTRSEESLLKAFDAGIDDYLTCSIGSAELGARIEALLRRQRHTAARLGGPRVAISRHISLDTESRHLLVRGQQVRLSPIEYSLLDFMLRNAGRVVTRRALLLNTWGRADAASVSRLNLYIHYLRRKLEDTPRHPQRLLTKRGVGYHLVTAGPGS